MGLQESDEIVKVLNFERHGPSSKDLSAREIRRRCRTVSRNGRGVPDVESLIYRCMRVPYVRLLADVAVKADD